MYGLFENYFLILITLIKQRILVVKVVPNSEKPGTFLFGAPSL